jgi:hypothetical protein
MDPARFVVRLLGALVILVCLAACLPVVLFLLLFLWLTGRLGFARNFIYRTSFGGPVPPRRPPDQRNDDDDAIEAEVIEAETVMEDDSPDAAGHSQNRLSR